VTADEGNQTHNSLIRSANIMARKQSYSKARSLRDDSEQVPTSMPPVHRIWLGVLLDMCLHAGIGFYVGKWGASGKVTVRVYDGDDSAETFLQTRDNPAEWFVLTAKHFFSAALIEQGHAIGAERAAQVGPGAAKKA
jgi:hypothetical protein